MHRFFAALRMTNLDIWRERGEGNDGLAGHFQKRMQESLILFRGA